MLFLDEIGDMPLALQARLLRVLQERAIQPLGSGDPIGVDIRVVCASHQNLRALVAQGRFREDLYYRINGLSLVLPPLREREDKREVIEQMWQSCREPQQTAPIPQGIMSLLMNHPWPGNLRQLHNVMQVALAMAEDRPLAREDLPGDFLEDPLQAGAGRAHRGLERGPGSAAASLRRQYFPGGAAARAEPQHRVQALAGTDHA